MVGALAVPDLAGHSVLWVRQVSASPHGRPMFGKIHAARQRQAVLQLLCQVCGGQPDRSDNGILWLLPGTAPAGQLASPLEVCYRPSAPSAAPRPCANAPHYAPSTPSYGSSESLRPAWPGSKSTTRVS